MSRRMMGVVAAIVLGALGTFVLVAYVRGAEDRAVAGEKMVSVVVAAKTIDAGTAAEDLEALTSRQRVPQKVRSDGAIKSLKDVRGLVTATDLVAGEVLLKPRFASPGEVTKGVGEVKIPKGYVEITLSLKPERAVGGLIKPGSRVAAIGTAKDSSSETESTPRALLVHQVLVTNVQIVDKNGEPSREETKDTAPTKDLLVTLAVDDETAAKILDFASNGDVWLGAEQKVIGGGAS
jgi:pilus assembly protein CpaB